MFSHHPNIVDLIEAVTDKASYCIQASTLLSSDAPGQGMFTHHVDAEQSSDDTRLHLIFELVRGGTLLNVIDPTLAIRTITFAECKSIM